jgi:putative phosphoribosyl transferase
MPLLSAYLLQEIEEREARVDERHAMEYDRTIVVDGVSLNAILGMPEKPIGAVVFAHGSGSGRLSPRNNAVARVLQDANMATLLADLLTEDEAADRRRVFDIPLLAQRLHACTAWLEKDAATRGLTAGYFGASTGAGAALVATADNPGSVRAVVSRGGRPDLAGPALRNVHVPTLLIVGSRDEDVLGLNRQALEHLPGPKRLQIVEGASHLFEEPGTLEETARLARDWFLRYLAA